MFKLKPTDRAGLQKLIRTGLKGHENVRAITLLFRDLGKQSRAEIAEALNITPRTVTNTCHNYNDHGLDRALKDDPRPGRPIKFDARTAAEIVALTCSEPPDGFDRWTLELLQEKSAERGIVESISKEKIRVMLKEHDLKPWLQKMWCVPELDEQYIKRMEKILDLYERGDTVEKPLVCLDEKPVLLREDSREAILEKEGSRKKVDYEYIRHGKANVFFAIEPYGGIYTAKVTERRTKKDFAHFLKELSDKYAEAEKISLVMDNLNTHNRTSLEETFGEREAERIWNRFEVYRTPSHGSWLNMAEMGIGMYARQCLGKTRIPDMDILKQKTANWENYINEKRVTINWTFTKEIAREKMNYNKIE